MTTIEHALLGVNLGFATGIHRRFGLSAIAISGFAAIAPDWDGLPMLIDMARFEAGHRVWGHNVLACLILGIAIGVLDWRLKYSDRVVALFQSMMPKPETAAAIDVREKHSVIPAARTSRANLFAWSTIAFLAALTQIPADAVVSGGTGLSDWPLKPLWPLSDQTFVYPMIPWGNLGVTIIFAAAMIVQAKWPSRVRLIAIASIALVAIYLAFWRTLFS